MSGNPGVDAGQDALVVAQGDRRAACPAQGGRPLAQVEAATRRLSTHDDEAWQQAFPLSRRAPHPALAAGAAAIVIGMWGE